MTLSLTCSLFTAEVLAVAIVYWAFFGGFAWKLAAFKAQLDAFDMGAVTDLAKLVFSSYAACWSSGANAFAHFWAFFASDSTNTNFHKITCFKMMAAFTYNGYWLKV